MTAPVSFDPDRLLSRFFPVETRVWDERKALSWARDFGAGLGGQLSAHDARWLDARQELALPMIAAPLCDGEFWQQQPDTGIDWRQIVHAAEVLTFHRPLPMAGQALLSQSITDIRDRGAQKGASMVQRLSLTTGSGAAYADLEVTTVLRGNGGFGGPMLVTERAAALPDRQPDASVEIQTPAAEDTSFCLPPELDLTAGLAMRPGQRMLRGTGCFGLAGRAALALMCGNDPKRIRRLGVRFAGPVLSGETVRFETWNGDPGQAVFRMRALERDVPVSRGALAFIA